MRHRDRLWMGLPWLALLTFGAINLARAPNSRRPAARKTSASASTPADRRTTPTVLAVRRASPAVVSIATSKVIPARGTDPTGGTPFVPSKRRVSLGSGVIIDAKGYVVTNDHVVRRATDILVRLADGRHFPARIVGSAAEYDLAVLRIIGVPGALPVAALGRSANLMPGEEIIAIGNPVGLSQTVSRGVLSSRKRVFRLRHLRREDFLQTDAAINPGNSGGALINILGEVVGIATSKLVARGIEGIGFGIPIDRVKRVMRDLLAFGKVRRAYLGLSVRDDPTRGVQVTRVVPSSPAAEAGLRVGMVITGVAGYVVADRRAFHRRVARLVPDTKVAVTIAGRRRVSVRVGSLTPVRARRILESRLGVRLGNASRYIERYRLGVHRGVVLLSVQPGGAAKRKNLSPGDVIQSVQGKATEDLRELDGIAVRLVPGQDINLVIDRRGAQYRLRFSF